jgi:hypothetical protein
MTPEWILVLIALAQSHPDILNDLSSMTWTERWSVYLRLRRLHGEA